MLDKNNGNNRLSLKKNLSLKKKNKSKMSFYIFTLTESKL